MGILFVIGILAVMGLLLLGTAFWLRWISSAEIVSRKIELWPGQKYGGTGGRRDYDWFIYKGMPIPTDYTGKATLPKKAYQGDSQTISLVLEQKYDPSLESDASLTIEDTPEGKRFHLPVPLQAGHVQYLEAELLAAGITIDGERKQQQLLASEKLCFQWSCFFINSGKQALSIKLTAKSPTSELHLGTIEQIVTIHKFDHMTQRTVSIISSVGSGIGFLAVVVSIVTGIAKLFHLFGQ